MSVAAPKTVPSINTLAPTKGLPLSLFTMPEIVTGCEINIETADRNKNR